MYIVCCSKSASRRITQRQEADRNSRDGVPQGVAGEGSKQKGKRKVTGQHGIDDRRKGRPQQRNNKKKEAQQAMQQ